MIKVVTLSSICIICSVILASCQPENPTTQTNISPTNSPPTPTVIPSITPTPMPVVVEVDMDNFNYSITSITTKPETRLILKLTNREGTHDLVIDEFNIKSKQLAIGESELLTINIPSDAGGKEYEYYCSVGNHRAMGMLGKIIIVE